MCEGEGGRVAVGGRVTGPPSSPLTECAKGREERWYGSTSLALLMECRGLEGSSLVILSALPPHLLQGIVFLYRQGTGVIHVEIKIKTNRALFFSPSFLQL